MKRTCASLDKFEPNPQMMRKRPKTPWSRSSRRGIVGQRARTMGSPDAYAERIDPLSDSVGFEHEPQRLAGCALRSGRIDVVG
jgi:hypothetical protein